MPSKTLMITAGVAGVLLVGACAYDTTTAPRSASAQASLDTLLTGRTAGPAQQCLSQHLADGMQVIDESTIAYTNGGTVYVNQLRGSCGGLGQPGYTLVTERIGSGELCDGDQAKVVDLSTGTLRGFCGFGKFTPYRRAS